MYFSIEGQDGVGKTTMINKLKEDLKDKNIIFVQEPYGENSPKLCKDIKNIIYNYDYLTKYQYNLLCFHKIFTFIMYSYNDKKTR